MDIPLEKKKGVQRRHLPYIIGGAIFLLLIGWAIFGHRASRVKVDSRALSIAEVTLDLFNDFIRVDGQVQPIMVVQLSPEEGGIVVEQVVEEGSRVEKGQIIVRLSNSLLDLQILNAEADLAEKQNFLRNTRVAMEQDKLNNMTEKFQLDFDIKRKQRTFERQTRLHEKQLIAKEEYLMAEEDYGLAQEKHRLITERLHQDSIYRSIQVDQMEDNLANMHRNVVLIRQRKEHLNVRSQIDGELGLLDVVLGQNVSPGQKIGQINDLSDFKIEALVDEHYIDRVKQGLEATFERQDKEYALRVRKVFPEVRGGKFRTELTFEGERPDNIRSGQTYYINLQLGLPTESILIPRGSFFYTTGGSWIFVLDAEGKRATRRPLKIGRQNPRYYEILEGLEPGEKVVISNYENYKNRDVLILK